MNAIEKYLKKHNLTISDLARQMDVPVATICRHIKGPEHEKGRSISWAMLKKYSQQGISVEELLNE